MFIVMSHVICMCESGVEWSGEREEEEEEEEEEEK